MVNYIAGSRLKLEHLVVPFKPRSNNVSAIQLFDSFVDDGVNKIQETKLGLSRDKSTVILTFGRQVAFIGMDRDEARKLAQSILQLTEESYDKLADEPFKPIHKDYDPFGETKAK